MGEILQIQIGNCGNRIGCSLIEGYCKEHYLDQEGFFNSEKKTEINKLYQNGLNVCFKESSRQTYHPRVLAIDSSLDSEVIIKSSDYSKIYDDTSKQSLLLVDGDKTWKFGNAAEQLAEKVFENVNKELEACSSPQGFIVLYSLNGGFGSGFGSLMTQKLSTKFKKKKIFTVNQLGEEKNSQTSSFGIFNNVASLENLSKNADMSFLFQNQPLVDSIKGSINLGSLGFDQINVPIVQTLLALTSGSRFSGFNNVTLGKIAEDLAQTSEQNMFTAAHYPLLLSSDLSYKKPLISELVEYTFNPRNCYMALSPDYAKYISSGIISRGLMSSSELFFSFDKYKKLNPKLFIPNPTVVDYYSSVPDIYSTQSITHIFSSTGFSHIFSRLSQSVTTLMQKRVSFDFYTKAGMSNSNFQEAVNHLNDMSNIHQNSVYELIEKNAEELWLKEDEERKMAKKEEKLQNGISNEAPVGGINGKDGVREVVGIDKEGQKLEAEEEKNDGEKEESNINNEGVAKNLDGKEEKSEGKETGSIENDQQNSQDQESPNQSNKDKNSSIKEDINSDKQESSQIQSENNNGENSEEIENIASDDQLEKESSQIQSNSVKSKSNSNVQFNQNAQGESFQTEENGLSNDDISQKESNEGSKKKV